MSLPRALKFVRYDALDAHLAKGWMISAPNAAMHHHHYGLELKWVCDCPVPGGFKPRVNRVPINSRETLQDGHPS